MNNARAQESLKATAELLRRNMDGLKMFRATDIQMEILSTGTSELLVRGGNRSGKSTITAIMFASIARGVPITGMNGQTLDPRQPWQKDRPLLMWCIGLGVNHIGQTLYRLLFEKGLFRIIRDAETGMWRAWNPVLHPTDWGRENECKPSPPLIPKHEIESISWAHKADKQFNIVRLKNGTEIYAFPSSGDVKAGDPVDIIWIDEEIKFPKYYGEWQARLSDKRGRLFWSSWPAAANPALMDVTRRAKKQAEEVAEGSRDKVDVAEFVLKFSDNPFIHPDEKRKRIEGWSEAERLARDQGGYITDLIKMYPEFREDIHCAVYADDKLNDPIADILRRRNGIPPRSWTRELILDPGTVKPGVLLCAIPPEEYWDHDEPYYIVYREIYTPRQDAQGTAIAVFDTERGYVFNRFIIDGQAGRQKPMGFSGTIAENYSKEFEKIGLRCVQTDSGFILGDPDPIARSYKLRNWLRVRPCGRPQLRIVVDNCPNLVKQMTDVVRAMSKDEILEKPADHQKDDLLVCLEYFASRDPVFVDPPNTGQMKSPGEYAYQAEQDFWNAKRNNGAGNTRGVITLGTPVSEW